MIAAKHLAKYLYIADQAICCDICGKDTWTAELEDDDIYLRQLWHDASCPLQARADVYAVWGSEREARSMPWRGTVRAHVMQKNNSRVHTLWLHTHDGKRYRLCPLSESGLENADPCLLDGREVDVVGHAVSGETLYFSMMISRF